MPEFFPVMALAAGREPVYTPARERAPQNSTNPLGGSKHSALRGTARDLVQSVELKLKQRSAIYHLHDPDHF